jgi:type VI secretion system secreted protein VgrG
MSRVFKAITPLGDSLMFSKLVGREQISRLFEFELEMVSESKSLDLRAMIGKDTSIEIEIQGGGRRYLSAQCVRIAQIGREDRHYLYRATLKPWLWYATVGSNNRIFQEKTAPDIIKEVLGSFPFPFSLRLTASYRTRNYCVQYQESDFNFVSRLMEEEGIYYYFEHASGVHTLILCDGIAAHSPIPGYATIPYIGKDAATLADEEHVDYWEPNFEVVSGDYNTDDYDFTKPKAVLITKEMNPEGHPNDYFPHYEWPGGYKEVADGEHYAKARIEELQAGFERCNGETDARGMAPGYLFTLKSCPRADQNREYLVLGVKYDFKENTYATQEGNRIGTQFRFEANTQPSSVPYRAERLTPRPRTLGPQTALVVGPAGEEIWTDKYSRIKVQFHWDHLGKKNENSSCWIRVASPWAGSKWGMLHIPRIGQEVVVDFEGGDPDYPLITGSVYNADQMPPWGLPEHATASGIKSHSSKEGGQANFNEFRFEDKKDNEQIYLHAERNLDEVVEADHSENVGHDRLSRIGHNETRAVKGHDHTMIGANQSLVVMRDQDVSIHGDQEVSIKGDAVLSVGRNRNTTIGDDAASDTLTVFGDSITDIGGSRKDTVKDKDELIVFGNQHSLILKDRKAVIAGSDTTIVTGDMTSATAKSRSDTVGIKYSLSATERKATIEVLDELEVLGNRSDTIIGARTATVEGVDSLTVGGAQSIDVGGAQTTTVGAAATTNIGAALELTAGATITLTAGGAIAVTAGGVTSITSGGAISITAPAITLNAAVVTCSGVLMATTVITASVVSPAYTPGVGNMV